MDRNTLKNAGELRKMIAEATEQIVSKGGNNAVFFMSNYPNVV